MRTRLLIPLVAVAAGAAMLSAQVRYRPTENGPWRPWSFTAIASARQDRGATAADVQAWQASLQQLAAIVKRAPAVAQPVGFAGELWGNLDGYHQAPGAPAGKAVPLAGSVSFGAFPLIEFTRNGRLMNEDLKGGETELLGFTINNIEGSMFSSTFPAEWSGRDVPAFTEPKVGAPFAGLTRIDDVFVVRNNERPLWVPMPLNEAVAPVIALRRDSFEHRRDTYTKEQAEFATWLTPAARAARRAEWQSTAKVLGTEGAAFLANMEKSDVEIEKARRAQLAPGGPDDRSVRDAERDLKEAEGLLEKLYPEARTAPACYDAGASTLAAKFHTVAGASRSCRPLVKTNWDYFDKSLPRTAPQILMVTSFTRCLRPESMVDTKVRGGCTINRALIESIDWNTVKGWLR